MHVTKDIKCCNLLGSTCDNSFSSEQQCNPCSVIFLYLDFWIHNIRNLTYNLETYPEAQRREWQSEKIRDTVKQL